MLNMEVWQEPQERDDWHSRWLAMQSAYGEYRRSSEVLESTRRTAEGPLLDDQLRLTLLEGQQRLAFERYVDARIAFLESRFDQLNRPPEGNWGPASGTPAVETAQEEARLLSRLSGRPILQTLSVLLLCTMAVCLMREHTSIRSLEAVNGDLRTELRRTSLEVQELKEKLDAASLPAHSTLPPSPLLRAKSEKGKLSAARKRAAKKPSNEGVATGSRGSSRHFQGQLTSAFSLKASREFHRVGPVSILVKSVDARKGTARVTVATWTTEWNVQQLHVNQPVWLNAVHHDHQIGLVAERMTGNRVEGHLLERAGGKHEFGAIRVDMTQ